MRSPALFGGLATLAGAALLLRWRGAADAAEPEQAEQPEPSMAAPLLGWAADTFTPGPTMSEDTAAANVRAFLSMIRRAEGTADALGYRALFGHTPSRPRTFASFADHPRQAQQFTDRAGRTLWTSAAGAYQFMAVSSLPNGRRTTVNTWDRIRERLQLPDFSPASQDAAAVELIREAGALPDVRGGRFDAAVSKVNRIWASLPGAGYAQPERTRDELRTAYLQAGGSIA